MALRMHIYLCLSFIRPHSRPTLIRRAKSLMSGAGASDAAGKLTIATIRSKSFPHALVASSLSSTQTSTTMLISSREEAERLYFPGPVLMPQDAVAIDDRYRGRLSRRGRRRYERGLGAFLYHFRPRYARRLRRLLSCCVVFLVDDAHWRNSRDIFRLDRNSRMK